MKFVTLALGLILTVNVFASDAASGPQYGEVSWSDLQLACDNPQSQGAQEPPKDVTVTCSHSKVRWEQAPAQTGLNTSRIVRGSLISNKYSFKSINHFLNY